MAATVTSSSRLNATILALHNVRGEIEASDEFEFRGRHEVVAGCGRESGYVDKLISSLRETVARRESGGQEISDDVVMHDSIAVICAVSSRMSQEGVRLLGLETVDYRKALLLMDTMIGHWERIRYTNTFIFNDGGAGVSELFEATRTMFAKEAQRLDPVALESNLRKN